MEGGEAATADQNHQNQNDNEAPPFLKALMGVLTQSARVEDFCEGVVQGAIADVLLRVATDYGISYTALVDRYGLVGQDHCRCAAGVVCSGTTKAGKRCVKRARVNGYCSAHMPQGAEEDARRKRVAAFQDRTAVRGNGTDDPVEALLQGLDVRDLHTKSFESFEVAETPQPVQTPMDC